MVIKRTRITKVTFEVIYWVLGILGILIYSLSSWLFNQYTNDPVIDGLRFFGAMLIAGAIAFGAGCAVEVVEN